MSLSKAKKSGIKKFFKWGLKLLFGLIVIVILLTVAQVATLRYVNPPFIARIAWIQIKNRVFSDQDIVPQYHWRALQEISPSLIKAVLAGEDQRFMTHHGFDFREINLALRDILLGKRVRGASTISMQVARSLFLWPGRSLIRKGAEAYYTILIELFLSKMRILELYLNVVDWGTGVIGAEAASQKYFNLSAADIDPSQAAGMAAILPNPHIWSPINPNNQVRERQKRIFKDMEKIHL